MDEPEEIKGEDKGSFGFGRVLLWGMVIVMVYVLSVGPVVVMVRKGMINGRMGSVIEAVYRPLEWAYRHTPLHEPLRMYLLLWDRDKFAKDGDSKR